MARTPSLSKLSLVDLDHLIDSRHRDLKKLHKRRREMQKQLDRFDRAIFAITGENGRAGRRGASGTRAQNDQSLGATIEQVLEKSSAPMSIADIVERVQARGYRSSSANFRGLVNMTLVKDNRFQNPERGMYVLKRRSSKPSKKPTARRAKKQKETAPMVEEPAA